MFDHQAQIEELIEIGAKELKEHEEAKKKAADDYAKQQAEAIAERWKPYVNKLAAVVPDWAMSFLSETDREPFKTSYKRYFEIPGLPIISVNLGNDPVFAVKTERRVVFDDGGEGEYIVTYDWGYEQDAPSFAAALVIAADAQKKLPELEAEAARKNRERAEKVAASVPTVPVPVLSIPDLRKTLQVADSDAVMRAIAYALLSIAESQEVLASAV